MASVPLIPYSPTEQDLFFPCLRGNFYAGGLPASEAALCAEFCRLCYCSGNDTLAFDRSKIAGVLTPLGFTDPLEFFESSPSVALYAGAGFHGMLARHPARNVAVLGFRGTNKQDLLNLAADALIARHNWPKGGMVHEGFAGALEALREQLKAVKASINCRLLITGHSLGAAMATLLASEWSADFKEMALYTFGSPRVGDVAFVATLRNVEHFRCVDCSDIVTQVPLPLVGIINYAHSGVPQYIDRHGTLTTNPGEGVIVEDRVKGSVDYLPFILKSGNNKARGLSDHTPINYVSGVMGIRAKAAAAATP